MGIWDLTNRTIDSFAVANAITKLIYLWFLFFGRRYKNYVCFYIDVNKHVRNKTKFFI